MIRVNNIHLSLDYDDKSVRKAVAQQLRIEEKSIKSCKIFRRSVDARKKDNIYFLTTVDAELNINEDKVCKKCGNAQIARKYEYNQMKFGNAPSPIVVGAGPAGLFAALILARSGEISPKMRTSTVVTIVETLAPFASPSIFTNKIVASEDDKIFTILFPIRIVDKRLSYFSSSSSTRAARLFPLSAIFFMRIRFRDKKAVSVAEK